MEAIIKKRRPCRNCKRKKYTDKMNFIMKTQPLFGNNLPMEVWECKNRSKCNKPKTVKGQLRAKLSLVPGAKLKKAIKEDIVELESRGPAENNFTYNLPDGRKVTIGKNVVDFFEQLLSLPAETKIQMMNISAEEMDKFIKDAHLKANQTLISLLKKNWFWRETGEDAIIYDFTIDGFPFDHVGLLKKCKSKKPFTLEEIKKLTEWFTSDRGNVYLKEVQLFNE